jgi:demethylmenaquinone methyltransferase/2-methoxy-6-polyprenyl-1,4-benzoquinol methylase
MDIPESVAAAQDRASRSGFELSSEPEVGQLMACLANAVPIEGRILEIGTGCGVGLAWIVHGLGSRASVEVVSVEIDSAIAASTKSVGWPGWVSIVEGDGADLVGTIGSFDLIFPDAPGGKDLQVA